MARIAILAPDLERNSFYTPWQFAGAIAKKHAIQIVGPGSPEKLWLPAREAKSSIRFLPATNIVQERKALLDAVSSCDLVYTFAAVPRSVGSALWVRRETGIRVVVHLDDWNSGYFSDRSVLRRIWYVLRSPLNPMNELHQRYWESRARAADALTVSTRALQRRFGGTVIRQGVDTDKFSPQNYPRIEARRRFGLLDEMRVVLFLGSPTRHKGVEDLIAAFRRHHDANTRLWIVGKSQDDDFQRQLESEGGGGVFLHPSVPMDDAGWYIAAADVFVVPQRPYPYAVHQIPAKLLHAMSHGACVIASDVGDIRDVLGADEGGSEAGFVVPPADPSALSAALRRTLEEPALRLKLGARARERAVHQLGWDAMSHEIEGVFASMGLNG